MCLKLHSVCVKLHTVFEITQCAQNYTYWIEKNSSQLKSFTLTPRAAWVTCDPVYCGCLKSQMQAIYCLWISLGLNLSISLESSNCKKISSFNFSSKPRQIKLSSCPSFDVVKDLRCIFACSWWHSQRKMQTAGRRGCNEPISSLSYSDDIHCRLHANTYTLNTLTFTAVLPVSSALTCPINYKLSMAIKSKLPHATLYILFWKLRSNRTILENLCLP